VLSVSLKLYLLILEFLTLSRVKNSQGSRDNFKR